MELNEKPFKLATEQISVINGGWLDKELGQALSDGVRAALDIGKQAEITVKLKIQPQNIAQGTVKISHDVISKLPKEKREGGIVFATPEGNIQANDPKQAELNLKGVGEEEPPKHLKLTTMKLKTA